MHNEKPVFKQVDGRKILFFSELDGFDWVIASSFSSGGGMRSKPGGGASCPSDSNEWEYYIPGTTNTWVFDSTATVKCDGEELCGIDTTIDSERLIAEQNSAYIFDFIDKTEDPTPGYRTEVFDVVVFNKDEKPHRIFQQLPKSLKYWLPGLFTLFLVPPKKQCNRQTFEDAASEGEGYYPLAIFTQASSSFKEAIDNFITDAKQFKVHYDGNLPKLCGSGMNMKNETAHLRVKVLNFIFNLASNNQYRKFSVQEVCSSAEKTIKTIKTSNLFDVDADLSFKATNLTANEDDQFVKITILRRSFLDKNTIGFVSTRFPESGAHCKPASEEDIVPFSNAVVFNKGDTKADIIVRIKKDPEAEEAECFMIMIEQASRMSKLKGRNRVRVGTGNKDGDGNIEGNRGGDGDGDGEGGEDGDGVEQAEVLISPSPELTIPGKLGRVAPLVTDLTCKTSLTGNI